MRGQPSVVPYRKEASRDISLKRRTITGKIVKEINFQVKNKLAPRSPPWPPGVALPSVEDCLSCVPHPKYPYYEDLWGIVTAGWFYTNLGESGEELNGVYEQIGLLAALLAIVVRGVLCDARHLDSSFLRGLCSMSCAGSVFLLVSSSFFALVHTVLAQKMKLESQVNVFNRLYYTPFIRFFSPIRYLQYGMTLGAFGGMLWICGFLEAAYSLTFFILSMIFVIATAVGFLRLVHAGMGVLEAEVLREGEQASLDTAAITILLDAYQEDCGSEFMNPSGFAAFCGECLLKTGCDPMDLCEFSHVTKLRMERMLEKRLSALVGEVCAEIMHGSRKASDAEGTSSSHTVNSAHTYAMVPSCATVATEASAVHGAAVIGKVLDAEEIKAALKVPDISPAKENAKAKGTTFFKKNKGSGEEAQKSLLQFADGVEECKELTPTSAEPVKKGTKDKGSESARRRSKKAAKVVFEGDENKRLSSNRVDASNAEAPTDNVHVQIADMLAPVVAPATTEALGNAPAPGAAQPGFAAQLEVPTGSRHTSFNSTCADPFAEAGMLQSSNDCDRPSLRSTK